MIYRALRTSRPLAAILLGLAGTGLILIAFWAGLDTGPELRSLDVRFSLTDAPLTKEILHVDIDDGSLEYVGRWPWPRQKLAAIIDVLKECGAKAVMVDLILNEPQTLRFEAPAYEVYEGSDQELLSQDAAPQPIFDDPILAESLTRAGNVFLATHIYTTDQSSATLDTYAATSRFMSDMPNIDLQPVMDSVPGDRRSVSKAYRRQRSINAMARFAIDPDRVSDINIRSGQMTPPLVTFVTSAAGVGCVTYLPDPDKLVRRTPLFFKGDGSIYPQFATTLALHELADRHGGLESMQADKSALTVRYKDGTERAIPLDSNGHMIIRWPSKAIRTNTYGLDHIPAATLVNIWMEKDTLRLNSARIQGVRTQFMKMGKNLPEDEELKKLYWAYTDLVTKFDAAYTKRIVLEQTLYKTILHVPSQSPNPEKLAELKQKEANVQKHLEDTLASLTTKLRQPGNIEVFLGKPPAPSQAQPGGDSPDQQEYLKALDRAGKLLRLETTLLEKNRAIDRNIALLTNELRPDIANKICMLGATGTGVPDFAPTPLGPLTPGVVVHSNIINTILSGNFVYPAGMVLNTLTIILAGALISFLAATRPILQAAPLSLLAAIGYAVINALVVFAWWGVWLAMVAPLGAMLASFLFVTGFRQLTEERAKRRIREMWAQSLSPALVEQILKNPAMVNLGGENTELTCMFSDLAGFTPLSESLGPQKTVALLNRYFDGVTDIVQNRFEGYLNKFLGDGVFVLFGVPIKMADHPSRAVDAALMCQAAVAKLNTALAEELGGEGKLKVRIGLHSGEAIFGNCGSTEKTDYTAIGDCVNLSARLESANKFFGTKIIVSQHAWSLCDRDDLLVRPLGDVFITGVRNSLKILEVVGPADEVDEAHSKATAHFAQAMDLISKRNFAEARTQLQQADQLTPGDTPTKIYLDICEQCVAWGSEINAWPAECRTSGGVVHLAWPERT